MNHKHILITKSIHKYGFNYINPQKSKPTTYLQEVKKEIDARDYEKWSGNHGDQGKPLFTPPKPN